MQRKLILLTVAVSFVGVQPGVSKSVLAQQTPELRDHHLQLAQFATAPDIVTPIGVTFDSRGRLLVIESHTHQRTKDYVGPKKDRIRIVEDIDNDGRADSFRTFYQGTEFTMSLARGPANWIYVATRMKIFRIRDTDGDDRADEEQMIAHLDTTGDYPHNGLSGLALDGKGKLYFGMGENLGVAYRLFGSDGARQLGSGEGGVFRCELDGKNLTRLATGFWNPFGICIDSQERVFAVGNDADGRPPCRLVHVVETGDYGFQFRYGRSGRHPLQAWDGELPGTLPMVAGTGEAPCEMVAYHGRLWVASWGDNRIERFQLLPVGASFRARREVVVQGDASFRPVGFAISPDGSLFFTDWVDKSYPVHRKGRIWRLSYKQEPPSDKLPSRSEMEERAHRAAAKTDWAALKSDDVFLRQAAVAGLVRSPALETQQLATLHDPRQRLGLLQALRWKLDHAAGDPEAPPTEILKQALADTDPDVRLYAVRWVADDNVKQLRGSVEEQLTRSVDTTPELFQATIATLELLDTGRMNFDPNNSVEYFVRTVTDEKQPTELRTLALRMIPPDHAALDLPRLRTLLDREDMRLKREVVRLLALSKRPDRFDTLAAIATDEKFPDAIRADSILGLSSEPEKNAALLKHIFVTDQGVVRKEASRGLGRLAGQPSYDHPPAEDLDAWLQKVGAGGDPDTGWRVFYGVDGASCAGCHRFQGRGAVAGPDLTAIAARTSRREVLQSILQPSRDIAPQFVASIIETIDGRELQGLQRGHDDKGVRERFLAADGSIFEIDPAQIETRRPADTSIMPAGLHRHLSLDDIRDLLALLSDEQ